MNVASFGMTPLVRTQSICQHMPSAIDIIVSLKTLIEMERQYLLKQCNWTRKIMMDNKYTEHIRNNNDRIEKSHSISSRITKKMCALVKKGLIKVKTMAEDNQIVEVLMDWFVGDTKHRKLLEQIMEYGDSINAAKMQRKIESDETQDDSLKNEYMKQHFHRIKRRKKTNKSTKKKKQPLNVANVEELEQQQTPLHEQLNVINVEELEQQHIQDIQKQKATKKKRKKKRKQAEMHQETECSAFEIENGSSSTWECSNMNQISNNTRRTSKRRRTSKYSNLSHCY
eukprot:48469_1